MTTISNNSNTFIPSNMPVDDWLNIYSRGLCSQHLKEEKDWNSEMNSSTSSTQENSTENNTEDVLKAGLGPLTPGSRLSHMLCNIGFNLIDYFTSEEEEPETKKYTSRQTTSSRKPLVSTNEDSQEINVAYWAVADVYASRTASIEKRRALSRSSSFSSEEPWMNSMERLGHWEESV